MKRVIKKQGKITHAYRLGEDHPVLQTLLTEGKIIRHNENEYEVFSQEAVNGKGQLAFTGDYIKIDASGYPYPNKAVYFKDNHRHIQDDEYEQLPKPLLAWDLEEEPCEEIEFLKHRKGLIIDPKSIDKTYQAYLWGCLESAPLDAHILLYDIKRDEMGVILDIDYNFIARKEFEEDYMEM